MIRRLKIWLVCEGCGEFFTEDMLKEGEICLDCKKAKVRKYCAECGNWEGECKCQKGN
jgi:hypothetical protein